MKLVDANVLLYAVNEAEPRHAEARAWLDGELSGAGTVGFAWIALLAFVRLSTKAGLYPRPLTTTAAIDIVRAWTTAPTAVVLEPTPRHATLLAGLLEAVGSGGNLVNDAHLAALALEHGAEVISYDTDFSRFEGVRVSPPATA